MVGNKWKSFTRRMGHANPNRDSEVGGGSDCMTNERRLPMELTAKNERGRKSHWALKHKNIGDEEPVSIDQHPRAFSESPDMCPHCGQVRPVPGLLVIFDGDMDPDEGHPEGNDFCCSQSHACACFSHSLTQAHTCTHLHSATSLSLPGHSWRLTLTTPMCQAGLPLV